MTIATSTALTIGALALTAASTGYAIASAPGTPPAPPIPKPPPGAPPPPAPPPAAPTAAQADTGVARIRRQQSRRFGLQQTLLTTPLGGAGTVGGPTATGPMTTGKGLLGS